MRRLLLAAALAVSACIPPAPCRPGLTGRLELGCHQIGRQVAHEVCWTDRVDHCPEAREYLDECLAAVDGHTERCSR